MGNEIERKPKFITTLFKGFFPNNSRRYNVLRNIVKYIFKYANKYSKLLEYLDLKITYKSPLVLSPQRSVSIFSAKENMDLNTILHSMFIDAGLNARFRYGPYPRIIANRHKFVIFPNQHNFIPKKFIALQPTSLLDDKIKYDEIIEIYKRASGILVCSKDDIEYLEKCGLPYKNIFYLPINTSDKNELEYYFKRFLLAYDNYDYNEFYKDKIRSDETINSRRICLTLTETVNRRNYFLSKPGYGFVPVDGLRHWIGWVGAGLSYKYFLSGLSRYPDSITMICEDDVVFPDDFESRLANVTQYLKGTKKKWHIFSGLIADLGGDTRILDIEEYAGVEYIYINRMMSMVFNIYSPLVSEIIEKWDHTNHDNGSNTIDKFLEKSDTLITVTTLPFLVNHAEEQFSTIWSHEKGNYAYSNMIKHSSERLEKLVKQFKLNIHEQT